MVHRATFSRFTLCDSNTISEIRRTVQEEMPSTVEETMAMLRVRLQCT